MKPVDRILASEIGSNLLGLGAIVGLMLLGIGFDVVAPWPFKILIDNVLAANPVPLEGNWQILEKLFNSRALLGFFVVFVYFLSTFALTVTEYLKNAVTKKVIKRLTANFSKRAFTSLQSLAIGFYNKQQIGDYIYRLSYDVSALGDFLEEGILPLITSGLSLGATLSIMFLIDFRLTILSLLVLPFLTAGLYFFNIYTSYATKRSETLNSNIFAFIEEALTHLKIIQAFSQQKRESKEFSEKTDTTLNSDILSYRLDSLLSLLVGVIIAVSYSIIILYGIRSVFTGTLTTGLLIVFIFYLDNLINPILAIIYAATTARESYIKIQRMNDFFRVKTHDLQTGKTTKITDTTIKFQHVTVVGGKKTKILRDVSFEIEPRKRTVIFGANGSGKTSIVNLILGFIDRPTSGQIFLGGIPLPEYDLKAVRDVIAFVPQEITLFNGSIRANIAFGQPRSSERDIVQAAKLAAADEFVSKLPGKYDFEVGEGGNFLSGGQRQRIMLARALLKKDSSILLFDETLSALDVRTRKQVLENLYRFSNDKTTILVSNIFDVVSAADNVIVLNKGRVIYSGPSSRLPREISLYKMIIDND